MQDRIESNPAWATPSGATILGRTSAGHLELRLPGEPPGRGVTAAIAGVLSAPPDRRHPLARVLRGLRADPSRPVLDATAGLGGDTAVAASTADRPVIACERHPLLAAILEHAVGRAREAGLEPAARIEVRPTDARSVLAAREAGMPAPALVILDPMFAPRRRNSALPPKPMQRLRALADPPTSEIAEREVEGLLAAAASSGADRIVLKRPPEAGIPASVLGVPTFQIETKLLRWLVWERRDPKAG